MKKTVAIIIALTLVFMTVPAFAAETETNEELARSIIEISIAGDDPRNFDGRDLSARLIESGGVLSEFGESWTQALCTAALAISAPANCREEDAAYRLILNTKLDSTLEACEGHSAFAVTALAAMALAAEGSYRLNAEEMIDRLEEKKPADACELAMLLCIKRQLGRSVSIAEEAELASMIGREADTWSELFAKMYFENVGFETLSENLGILRKKYVDGHLVGVDAKSAVESLVSAGIVRGRTDGRLDMTATVTRAELAKLLVGVYEAMNGAFAVELPEQSPYSDVDENAWCYPYLVKTAEYGLMLGNGETFAPNAKVTRVECAITLRRILEIEETEAENYRQYCDETMKILAELGILDDENMNGMMTREEICVTLVSVMNRGK